MADYFVRADLARGELRRCYPGVVPADAIDDLVEALDRITLSGQATVPGRPGFTLIGGKAGQSLSVALHGPDGGLMLTIAVCLRSRDSARVWAKLHDGQGGLLTRGDSPPATPWLAERVEAGAVDHMADMRWTGSLAQAVAWAWQAYQRAAVRGL